MPKKLKFFTTYFQCPSCWFEFKDTKSRYFPQYFDDLEESLCPFCEKKPSSFQILKRQIENLPDLGLVNIPYFLQDLIKHLNLKE